MITNKRKHNTEHLSGYGNQSLHLQHSSSKMFLILFMHYSSFTNYINSDKKQKLSHKRSTSFGDASLSIVYSGTYLKKIKSCIFQYFGNGIKISEITNFTYKATSCDFSDSFYRNEKLTIRYIFEMATHFGLDLCNKTLRSFNCCTRLFYFKKYASPAFLNTYSRFRGFMKLLNPIFIQFSTANSFQNHCQAFKLKFCNILRLWKMFKNKQIG